MILDSLDRLADYGCISPLMDRVLDFLHSTELESLKPGRIDLQGDDLFVNVNLQDSKTREEAPIEAHRDYIDIQIPISCDEEMGYQSLSYSPSISVPYDASKDIAFYDGMCDSYIKVRKGMFVVFFPGEGHAPGIVERSILKIIVKIRKSC